MRGCLSLLSLVLVGILAGCGSPLSGTWQASGPAGADHPIAGVTFCHDGTFTANADYGSGKSHMMSGCYKMAGDKLTLCTKESKRDYSAKLSGDCLEITHEGKTQKLCRMKCNVDVCCADGAACCKPM